ncbi:MAG: pilus assembly protein [Chloroflexi bacterium]|nr:pilus assembly protein [Chloroflexota bacterium]MBU1749517.1 pilus assembly protein [Chloroflexota bacterium]
MRKWIRRTDGQSYLETALLLPFLLLLIMGVLDLGRAFNAQIIVTNAAREGARFGMAHSTDVDGIKTRTVQEVTGTGLAVSTSDVAVAYPTGSGAGNPIRVTVTHQFQFIVSQILGLNSTPIVAAMEMEIIK